MAWEKMSSEEQQTHPLYGKRCAITWFTTGMWILTVIGGLSSVGHAQDYEKYAPGSGLLILAYDLMPAAFTALMLVLFSLYGKSKRSAIVVAIMLILLPVVKTLSLVLGAECFGENAGVVISAGTNDVVGTLFLCVLFLVVYLVYGFFSSTFNVQYLSRKRA